MQTSKFSRRSALLGSGSAIEPLIAKAQAEAAREEAEAKTQRRPPASPAVRRALARLQAAGVMSED